MASELVGRRIRVNVISSGPISMPLCDQLGVDKETLDQVATGILAGVPLKRFGTSEEVARSVAFLARDDAWFITG